MLVHSDYNQHPSRSLHEAGMLLRLLGSYHARTNRVDSLLHATMREDQECDSAEDERRTWNNGIPDRSHHVTQRAESGRWWALAHTLLRNPNHDYILT